MKIVVDSMGGDNAPSAIVQGTVAALNDPEERFEVLLTGDESQIKNELATAQFSSPRLQIRHTTQVVTMDDRPSQVPKAKPNSSLVVGIQMVLDGQGDAFVSAGSTGAVLSTALLLLGRIEGVRRPALGVYFPVRPRGLVLCDVGANLEVKPRHILQFAIMASEYMKHIQGVDNPRVGLLNVGAEPTKGKGIYIDAYKLLEENLANFYGNIESRYLLDSLVDVVVCDGFVGNNLVKFAEGWIGHVKNEVFRELARRIESPSERKDFHDLFAEVMREYEYEEYGGVPLLGVNGVCIVCHGSSPERAIKNAIFVAKKSIEEQLVDSIREGVSATSLPLEST